LLRLTERSAKSFPRPRPGGERLSLLRSVPGVGCTRHPSPDLLSSLIKRRQDEEANACRVPSGGRAGERQSNHLRLAESSAEIDAVRLTLRHNIKLLIDSANSGDDLSTGERLRIRGDITFAGKLCHRATQRLFETGGAHAILRSAPLQRFTRDVDAAFHSGVLNWDPNGEACGRFRLGLAPNTFFF
jgi:acyl-CoA dehydrogenase-like protein